jgi:hypothetical protein
MDMDMERKRTIHKLSTVLDLYNHESTELIGKPAVRIRYDYDGPNNSQEFTVLNRDIPRESAERIVLWLNNNIKSDDIIYGLKSNNLDAGNY